MIEPRRRILLALPLALALAATAVDLARQATGADHGTSPHNPTALSSPCPSPTAQGKSVPAAAYVDACANRITFTGPEVHFVVEAVPPGNPDMTFRIAGLINPTIVVQQGAAVTIELVNDDNEAHGWTVIAASPPFAFHPPTAPAFPHAATIIGAPANGHHNARTTTFTAAPAGQYQYICPMPGHAEMGMHAAFIVAP
jgi:rusticyanin